ncbi:MAG: S24 family peptidase [Tannerella sp.]|jgi:phage repressor protein C with HTH and peptisase S24 domain|nr:S24 family peptidase [Tannerella sp.]
MTTKERINKYLAYKKIGKRKFEEKIGVASGRFSSKSLTITSDVIEKLCEEFPSLNLDWLITGKGSMEKDGKTNIVTHDYADEYFRGGSPFYSELPVSAGESGELIPAEEVPSGYIKIPGISPLAYFPVVGFSMRPEINPGDVIGVVTVNSWDRVDPDKTYMIITHEERMIKHLRVDNEREDILWCFSPNYKDFILPKEDIRAIYHVVFTGRLM